MDAIDIIGTAAMLCSTISFVPQAWKVIRTRDTAAISKRMYIVTVIGFALWLTYGWVLGKWPLIASNGICLALSAFILWMKVLPRYRRDAMAAALDLNSKPVRH